MLCLLQKVPRCGGLVEVNVSFVLPEIDLTHLTVEVVVVVGPFTTSEAILSAYPDPPSHSLHLNKPNCHQIKKNFLEPALDH